MVKEIELRLDGVLPCYVVESSLWPDIGAQRRRYTLPATSCGFFIFFAAGME